MDIRSEQPAFSETNENLPPIFLEFEKLYLRRVY